MSSRKLFERLLFNRIYTRIREIVPAQQAGLCHKRNCVDKVMSLTIHIKAGFQKRLRTTVTFIDLREAYVRRWLHGVFDKLIIMLAFTILAMAVVLSKSMVWDSALTCCTSALPSEKMEINLENQGVHEILCRNFHQTYIGQINRRINVSKEREQRPTPLIAIVARP